VPVNLGREVKRLLCYSSGAMRGVYYAGVMTALDEAGIKFSDIAGVSVGSTAAVWHAAGQIHEVFDAWEALCSYSLSPHPLFNTSRSRNLDWLITNVSLPFLDMDRLKASNIRVHIAASRIFSPLNMLKGKVFERRYFRFQGDFQAHELVDAIRASCYMPFINGIFSSKRIDGVRYLDGGLTGRIPVDCVDTAVFDEVWIAAASPNGVRELFNMGLNTQGDTEFIFIVPSIALPTARGEIDLEKFKAGFQLGLEDTGAIIKTREQGTG